MTWNTVHSQSDDRERDKGMTHLGHLTPKLSSVSQVKESVQFFVCVCVRACVRAQMLPSRGCHFSCSSKALAHISFVVITLFNISSSLGPTTSIFNSFGHLNIWFTLITILDAANPILYFQFLHVIPYVTFPSVLWSPLWSYWHRFPLIYFFLHSLFRHSM